MMRKINSIFGFSVALSIMIFITIASLCRVEMTVAFLSPVAKKSAIFHTSKNINRTSGTQWLSNREIIVFSKQKQAAQKTTASSRLYTSSPDLDVIALVVGQENYGLAIVCFLEGLWSFLSAPVTVSNGIRTLAPAIVAAAILAAISGPMITGPTADAASIGTGLWIATAVTVALGVNYVLRLIAVYSESPKEIAALGLLVAVAGFFSFSQNLIVDGFVSLPSLPTIELPSLF